MDSLFEVSFSPLAESGKAFSRCGKCRRYMKYIQTKPARLHCSHCDETYSLPNGGNIKSYREFKCPLDDFELLAFSTGTKGRSFAFCPYCFNDPPFKDMPRNSGCSSCTHPTCPHSVNVLGIASCGECDYGVLVLDCTLAPTWKLGCNRCDVIINCFKGASKVSITDKKCLDCSAQLVHVIYKSEKSKFKDGSEEKSGCVFCSSEFTHLIEKHHAISARPSYGHGSRGRGRGRGARAARGNAIRGARAPRDKMAHLAAYFV